MVMSGVKRWRVMSQLCCGREETVMSERWVAPTKVELEMGGAIKLWERRTDGGLGCGEKTDSEEG